MKGDFFIAMLGNTIQTGSLRNLSDTITVSYPPSNHPVSKEEGL